MKTLTAALALLLIGSFALTGCSKDDAPGGPSIKEGVVFNFKRKLFYATGVDQFGSVKITLSDGQQEISLPSSTLEGDENLVSTSRFALPAGDYKITGYTAYNKRQDPLFEIELDSLNAFTIEPANITSFTVPVKARTMLDQNPIRNALLGLCKEVFGDDKSTWPWDPSPDKYPYPDWEGLEFEFDDFENPMFITGINFDAARNGEPTGWAKMTEMPDGTISGLPTILSLTFNDLPDFKALPGDLPRFPALSVITINKSGIEELPANLASVSSLQAIIINGCQLKAFPAGIEQLTDLRELHLRGNQIPKVDVSLEKLTKLESVDLSHNPITSLPDNLFAESGELIELVLSNTELSAVPASIGRMTKLRRVDMDNCKFTAVPAPVKSNTGILEVRLGGNPLSGIAANDFANLNDLEVLTLAGTKLSTLPKLSLGKLMMLDMTGCGLTAAPDLSELPNLRMLYIGANDFATLPTNYFANNKAMRILNLNNSPKLTSMPANLGLDSRVEESTPSPEGVKEPVKDGYKERFKWLDVENCPSLTWVTPAAWQCFDGKSKEYKPETRRPEFPEGSIYDEYFGRVAVYRAGSPKVTFGK